MSAHSEGIGGFHYQAAVTAASGAATTSAPR